MKDSERQDEARRTLERLDQQSEKMLSGPSGGQHEDDDKIEILGKRIARVLSVILLIGLIFYLWRTYFSGS